MALFSSLFSSCKGQKNDKELIEEKDKMETNYPISQIKRTRIIEGKLVYSIINNGGSYFVIDLPIYEDGVFDCWENVDINGLKNKIIK